MGTHIIIPMVLGIIFGSTLQFLTNRYGCIRCTFGIHTYKLKGNKHICTRCYKEYNEGNHGKRK